MSNIEVMSVSRRIPGLDSPPARSRCHFPIGIVRWSVDPRAALDLPRAAVVHSGKVYRLSKQQARQRVLYSTDTITDIARSVGYSAASDFARHYAEAFGVHPADERRRLAGLRGLAGTVPPDRRG